MSNINTAVNIAGVEMKNPVTTASGTFGSGREFGEFVDLNLLGAVTVKGVSNQPWKGNSTPRIAETYGGMLNSVGLQNPGAEYFIENEYITLNSGRKQVAIKVSNTGDRPVQVGSHFHFFEVNKCLEFVRKETFGMRLDIPSGTAVRFEPGEEKEITLTEFAGNMAVFGLNGLTSGSLEDKEVFGKAMKKAAKLGFKGVDIK